MDGLLPIEQRNNPDGQASETVEAYKRNGTLMQNALVTGGAGFIGSHLVSHLLAQNYRVRVLDNLSTGSLANLEPYGKQVEWVEDDIRNAVACRAACRDIDVVFHLAAFISVPQSVQDPIQSDAINTGGTLNLLLAARDLGVRRFVFSSSAAVYGNTETVPAHEGVLPAPMSPYGVQKLMGEHYARNFTQLYGLETVCLRYFNVYGPRQNPYSQYSAVIPRFITRLLADQVPIVFGDGEQTRDFCFVEDVVAANLRAAQTAVPEALGGVFNIASGVRLSLNTLLQQMAEILGKRTPPQHEAARVADIRHSGADITLASRVLGYTPQVDLPRGLAATCAYYSATR
jgi:nucleoside-diphosphate-sugar epimerase